MYRLSIVTLSGTLVFAVGVGGLPANSEGGQPDQPMLGSDLNSMPVPSFALPSDKIQNSNELLDYLYRTDPTGQVVDNVASPNIPTEKSGKTDAHFLTYDINTGPSRVDTTSSACEYYKVLSAVTGVTGCGPKGELLGTTEIVNFEKWKQDVKIDKYGPQDQTDVAHFINQVDLNLTRNHHMVSYGPEQLAGYVCNHTGPAKTAVDPTGLFPGQTEINALIRSIAFQSSLVACVAMEYSTRGPEPSKAPFTKFFIFGANGALLSTVDLDGRGPKGVPNVCTACHGGYFDYNTPSASGQPVHFDQNKTTYYPDAPTNTRPKGDLGAHFLPFDKENLAFSSKQSPAEQDERVFKLNWDVYNTEITRANSSPGAASITDLISRWYQGNLTRDNAVPGFDSSNVSSSWHNAGYDDAYLKAYAHSCRTCHVAMDKAAIEQDPSIINFNPGLICNSHLMPNAKVTYDRFWLSYPSLTFPPTPVPGQPASAPDQPDALLNAVLMCTSFTNP